MDLSSLSALDAAALVILSIALVRGLWIGLVREAFSLGAIAAACVVVRIGLGPATEQVLAFAGDQLDVGPARVIAGGLLAVATLVVVGIAGRVLRRGVRAVGLGAADRLLGGALGAAEGGLVLALVLLGSAALLGRDHPALEDSRAFAVFEQAEAAALGRLPNVASAPPSEDG